MVETGNPISNTPRLRLRDREWRHHGALLVAGKLTGLAVLLAFIVGLLSSNTLIAATAAYGFLRATRSFRVYAAVAVVTGAFSIVVGTLFLAGKGSALPAIFGG